MLKICIANVALCMWLCSALSVADPPDSEQHKAPATQPATQIESPPTPPPPHVPDAAGASVIRPFPDVEVHRPANGFATVEVKAWTCLDNGLLEQVACAPQTREHESLFVIKAKPSQIHAALLMAGFKSGSPGKWVYEQDRLRTIPPTGEKLAIVVRYNDPKNPDRIVESRVSEWIRATAHTASTRPTDGSNRPPAGIGGALSKFPDKPWIFGGSAIVKQAPGQPQHGGETDEHYMADRSGSIIGLVTFGDEVIGFSEVLADEESVMPAVWEVNSDVVPSPGTPVTLIIGKWQETTSDSSHP